MKPERIAAKLTPAKYEENFADLNPLLKPQQAFVAASRCLYCFDAPCVKACPTRIDVPSFIKKIATGNLTGSARVILGANVLGESCGRVCPTEVLCEGACVLNGTGERPVEIGRLQRYAVNHVLSRGISPFSAGLPNGRRVACIGSGPASLACAAKLAQRGYAVEIFDRNAAPGGLNTYGIAAYKSRAEDSLREVGLVEGLGVRIHQGVEVTGAIVETTTGAAQADELSGTEAGAAPAQAESRLSLADIEARFDAVFVGVGLGETWDLRLPGEDLRGVYGAMEFIERTKSRPFGEVDVGRRVAVIGAGNTAVDVVTAARRLGAEAVYMVYRRGEDSMPAFAYEYELAKQDGVIFLWNTQPLAILGHEGAVTGLECARTRLEGRGRFGRVEIEPESSFVLAVDMVVKALGQQPVTEFLRAIPGIELTNGRVAVDPATHQTANPKYFAGGDCVNGGREVVDAVAEGMAAALGIDGWLGRSRQSTVESRQFG